MLNLFPEQTYLYERQHVRFDWDKPRTYGDGTNNSSSSNSTSSSSSGSGSGGSGSGSSSSSTSTATTIDKTNENVTYDRTDTKTGDKQAAKNLQAVYGNQAQGIVDAQDAANTNYLNAIDANANIANASELEANRQANNSWYQEQQKLQNVYQQLRNSEGNGMGGSGANTLNSLATLYDDQSDQTILNNQRNALQSVYSNQYQADQEAYSDYQANLATQIQNLNDLFGDFVTQYGDADIVGSTTKTTGTVTTKNDSNTTTTTESNTSSSGDSSTSNSTSTTTGDVNSTITGGLNTDTQTNANPYVNDDGTLNWDALTNLWGISKDSLTDVSTKPTLRTTDVSRRGNSNIQSSLADLYGSNSTKNTNYANAVRYGR